MNKSNLEKLEEIEHNINRIKNLLQETQNALRETLPYAIEHWEHDEQTVMKWKRLAGVS